MNASSCRITAGGADGGALDFTYLLATPCHGMKYADRRRRINAETVARPQ